MRVNRISKRPNAEFSPCWEMFDHSEKVVSKWE